MSGARTTKGHRPTQLYDVVVIGNELPGLVAGALLAKRGLRVLHVDNGGPHDRHASGGFLLPGAPALLPPLRAIPALHSIFEELGVLPMVARSLRPFAGGLQLLLPDARLSLGQAPDLRRRELERAFGPDGARLSAPIDGAISLADRAAELLDSGLHLPADGLVERWKASRRASKAAGRLGALPLSEGNALASLLVALHRFASRLDGAPTALGYARATAPWLFDAMRPPDEGLVGLLRASIRNHRGDTLGEPGAPARVAEVALEGGRFAGVRLEGQDAIHRGRVGLAAHPLGEIVDLLASPRKKRALERHAERLPASRRLVSWNLVVAADGIPPGLGELAAVAGADGEATLLLREPARRESGEDAAGLFTITAARAAGENVAQAEAHLSAALEEALPFHDRHLRHRTEAPARLPLYRPQDDAELSGVPIRGPVPRLLVANQAVLPGLGLEGGLLSGLKVAALTEELARKVKL
ncbi:MAG TPA: hypothetical protein VGD74_03000 [Vulgatibacter sp.]